MTTQGGASFDPDMRAGDADRERLVEELREHHAAGRLTLEEFDERMTKAYEAKTYGELRTLTRDLPVDLAQLNFQQAQQRTAQSSQRPVEVRRDESGRMQINIDNQAIQDRINHHLERQHRALAAPPEPAPAALDAPGRALAAGRGRPAGLADAAAPSFSPGCRCRCCSPASGWSPTWPAAATGATSGRSGRSGSRAC